MQIRNTKISEAKIHIYSRYFCLSSTPCYWTAILYNMHLRKIHIWQMKQKSRNTLLFSTKRHLKKNIIAYRNIVVSPKSYLNLLTMLLLSAFHRSCQLYSICQAMSICQSCFFAVSADPSVNSSLSVSVAPLLSTLLHPSALQHLSSFLHFYSSPESSYASGRQTDAVVLIL